MNFIPIIRLLLVCLGLGGSGCAGFHRMGVNTAAPLLYRAGDALMEEGNWELFRASVPANLAQLEGLLKSSPHNEKLLATLIKGHAGQAYGVWETLLLGEIWSGREGDFYRRQAVESYSRAIHHGMKYLRQKGVSPEVLHRHLRGPEGVQKLLRRKLGDDPWDRDAVLFAAQALVGLINLQKQNIALVGELSLAKELFDHVCALHPDYHSGVCGLFYGAYLAGRPRMLGGNPQEGKKVFERSIRQYPQNYLLRMAFIEYYIVPRGEKALYQKQKIFLEKALIDHRNGLIWNPVHGMEPSSLRLYQAIALKRFELLKNNEKEIF